MITGIWRRRESRYQLGKAGSIKAGVQGFLVTPVLVLGCASPSFSHLPFRTLPSISSPNKIPRTRAECMRRGARVVGLQQAGVLNSLLPHK